MVIVFRAGTNRSYMESHGSPLMDQGGDWTLFLSSVGKIHFMISDLDGQQD